MHKYVEFISFEQLKDNASMDPEKSLAGLPEAGTSMALYNLKYFKKLSRTRPCFSSFSTSPFLSQP
jgi:hypothetical protein